MKIVLSSQEILYVTDYKIVKPTDEEALSKWRHDDNLAKCYMLAFMSDELQKQHEHYADSSTILQNLHELFDEPPRFTRCIEILEALNFTMDAELHIDWILASFPETFGDFITHFHMTKTSCTLPELSNSLVVAQGNFSGKGYGQTHAGLTISHQSKKKGKKGGKLKGKKKIEKKAGKGKELNVSGKYFHCNEEGHWKRNCPKYTEFRATKKAGPS
ncbi:hypothetical protein M569_04583 [Genlisea aurea]|uniref:CCHC-type domain-containing protein n=1 Tax=Genlisea aurea TaxID=192259 RepID=S8E395_9LAMI|nr:hypothetical protein M569_04583 [Genlisea aurea]